MVPAGPSRPPPKDVMPGFEEKLGSGSSTRPVNVLMDGLAFISYGAQAISQDEFSKCFVQKPRTKFSLELLTVPLYWHRMDLSILLPPSHIVSCSSSPASAFFFLVMPIVLRLKSEPLQRWLFKFYCGAFLRSWGSQIRYHGKKPKLNYPHLFVSNHTSVIDYVGHIVLSAHDFPHATVAQTHGGLIGYFEHSVLTLNGSLMFNRNEKKDRNLLTQKEPLRWTQLSCLLPLNAYWHSKTQTFTTHILYLMTRWALVADVWYLPPETLKKGKTSSDFANEDKQERLKENPQFRYGAVLMSRMRTGLKGTRRDKFSYLRRSNSICLGDVSHAARMEFESDGLHQPEWLENNKTTETRNSVLVALLDEDGRNDMIQAITEQKSNILDVWKNFTKVKGGDQQRRLENSSWRLWFKQRIDYQRRKEAAHTNSLETDSASVLPLTPVIVVENALQMISNTVDYFSLPLHFGRTMTGHGAETAAKEVAVEAVGVH
ncbi:hypothetical protein BC829DRAFT_447868 [Chytridium lagenaria]|nr:hypothetical protein BC829DRAFT_447868 [Chytridium lagenaria]